MRSWLRLHYVAICSLLLFFSTSLLAGERPAEHNLQRSIDKLFTKKLLARASTSIKVLSAETGEVLYERNAQNLLTPASTTKLVSSATALAKLGPSYRFRTAVSTDDTSDQVSTIIGDLYLRGDGDPYLTTADLKRLSVALRERGVREVLGNVIGDESFFEHSTTCYSLPRKNFRLNRLPHLSALTVDMNVMTVTLTPGRKKGSKANVAFASGGAFFKIINQCVTVNERVRYRPAVKITWKDDEATIRISGKIPLGSRPRTYALHVESPAWYAAALFREFLEQEGITVVGGAKVGTTPSYARELVRNETPIQVALTAMNKESDNFAAEMVLRTIGAEMESGSRTLESGIDAMSELLDEAGVPRNSYRLTDGSGISHQNAVSAHALTSLLRYMYFRKDLFEVFRNTLPYAGVDGTLKGRMIGTGAAGNLQAKTGTLSGVTALAGYVVDADDELLIFSITSADFAAGKKGYKSLQDKIGIILAGFSRTRF